MVMSPPPAPPTGRLNSIRAFDPLQGQFGSVAHLEVEEVGVQPLHGGRLQPPLESLVESFPSVMLNVPLSSLRGFFISSKVTTVSRPSAVKLSTR